MKKLNYKLLVGIISTGVILTQTNVANAMDQSEISGYKTKYYYGLVEKKSTPIEVAYKKSYRNDYSNRYKSYRKSEKSAGKNYVSLSLGSAELKNQDREIMITDVSSIPSTTTDASNQALKAKGTGASIRLAIGSYVTDTTRFELSYTMQDSIDLDNSSPAMEESFETSTNQYMINVEKDIFGTNDFNIFLGAGIGMAQIENKSNLESTGRTWTSNTEETTNFAWEVKVGSNIKIDEKFEVFGNLTYSNLGNHSWVDEGYSAGTRTEVIEQEAELVSQKLEIGIRYRF